MDCSESLKRVFDEQGSISDLTDLSDDDDLQSTCRKKAKQQKLTPSAAYRERMRKWFRELDRMVVEARTNKVCADFDIVAYERDLGSLPRADFIRRYPVPKKFKRLDNSAPHLVVDAGGRPIAWHFPRFLKSSSLVEATQAAMTLAQDGQILKMTAGDAKGKGGRKHYVGLSKGDNGMAMLVPSWHMTGHPDKPALPAKSLVAPSTVHSADTIHSFLDDFQSTAQRMNYLLWKINPQVYSTYLRMRELVESRSRVARAAGYYFNSVWMGLAMIFNKRTPKHLDTKGSRWGLDGLLTLGSFRRGDLRMEALGYDFSYEPGSVVITYGRILEHEVLDFEGLPRICAAFFTHEDVLKEVGLKVPDIVAQNERDCTKSGDRPSPCPYGPVFCKYCGDLKCNCQ